MTNNTQRHSTYSAGYAPPPGATWDPVQAAQGYVPVAQSLAQSIYGDIKPPPGYGDSVTAINLAQNRGSLVGNILSQLLDSGRWAYQNRQLWEQWQRQQNGARPYTPPVVRHINELAGPSLLKTWTGTQHAPMGPAYGRGSGGGSPTRRDERYTPGSGYVDPNLST
jgi:hypothetical protein